MYKIYSTLTKNRIWLSTVHKHKSAIIKWTKLRWTRCIHWCNDMTWHRKSHLFKSTGWMKILRHIYTVLRHLYYSDNIVLWHYKTCTLYLSPAVTQHSFTITLLLSDNDVNILCEKKKKSWLLLTCSNPILYYSTSKPITCLYMQYKGTPKEGALFLY